MTTFQQTISNTANDSMTNSQFGGAWHTGGVFNYMLYVGNEGLNGNDKFYLLFTMAAGTIPAGSTIDSAIVTLIAANTLTGETCDVDLGVSDEANPSAPTNYATAQAKSYPSVFAGLPVSWVIPTTTAGQSINTPSLVSAIQYLLDTYGAALGNILVMAREVGRSSADAFRSFAAVGNGSYSAAQLTINYTAPVSPTPKNSTIVIPGFFGFFNA